MAGLLLLLHASCISTERRGFTDDRRARPLLPGTRGDDPDPRHEYGQAPLAHDPGCGRLIVSCRSSRLGSFARASPLRGRPRLRRFGFAAFGFGAAFSRASIAVASREMCSTRWPSIVRAISVSCRRFARRLSARKRPATTAPLQPHSRHSCRQPQDALARRNSNTAFGYEGARQRRAMSSSGRPRRGSRADRDPTSSDRDVTALALAKLAFGALLKGVSNPIAPRLHSSVGIMRCLLTAHDTQESGPVPPQGPPLRRKSRSPSYFARGSGVNVPRSTTTRAGARCSAWRSAHPRPRPSGPSSCAPSPGVGSGACNW